MVNEYKKIVLLKGLENISDYHFKAVKSLLTHDLRLTRKMQDQLNRIQIADMMEEKFQHDAGLDKLIEFFEDIPTLKGLAKTLRKEKLKAKGKNPSKKSKQGELGPATLAPATSKVLTSEGAEETPVAQKRKNTTTEKTGTKKKKVPEEQMQPPYPAGASTSSAMGHAPPAQISSPVPSNTSSTEKIKDTITQTCDSKQMNPSQKQCPPPQTSVISPPPSEFHPQNFRAVPQNSPSSILTKNMKDSINQNYDSEGMKSSQEQSGLPQSPATRAPLTGSHPRTSQKLTQSPFSRFLKQIQKKLKQKNSDSKSTKLSSGQSQLPKSSVASTAVTESHAQTPQMPTTTPCSSSLTKTVKDTTNQTYDSKKMKPSQEKSQPLQTAAISPPPSEFHPQDFQALPQTPSSTFLIQKEKDKITQYYASRNMKLSQVDSRPAQSSVISKSPTVTQPQIFQRVPQTTSSSSLTKCAENYTRPSSRNSASATNPLSGSSSRQGSGDNSSLLCPDTSLSELWESLSEVEEKYKKARVSNAQLDNEKNNLIYQVDTLKDVTEEQEEQMEQFYRENEEKSNELERQKCTCSVLQYKMNELKESLWQKDELIEALDKQKEYIACLRNDCLSDWALSGLGTGAGGRRFCSPISLKMLKEYKKIVLLKGLECLDEYNFRMFKSLLVHDLQLTRKMQDEYDKIMIADLMEETFRVDAGLNKLIEFLKDIPQLRNLAKKLQREKLKVTRKFKVEGTTTVKKSKQDKPRTAKSVSTTNKALEPESIKETSVLKKKKNKTSKTDDSKRPQPAKKKSQFPEPSAASTQQTEGCSQTPHMPAPTPSGNSSTKKRKNVTSKTEDTKRTMLSQEMSWQSETSATSICPADSHPQTAHVPPPTPSSCSSTKKPRLKTVPKEASKEDGYQSGPKEVTVLKATEPFVYEFRDGERKMFHATVATESEFFQVKVFNTNLKEMFTPKKVIAISDYFGRNGFLEVYSASCVSDVNADRKMEISSRLIKNANATPKINHLCSQTKEKFVNGVFMVHKKNVREECTFYEIQDNTGKMEVVVYGRLTSISCEEGDKLKLICFELALSVDKWQLRSVIHSYMKVIKAKKSQK
ncbi:gamma-interferon-inducible protein 16-like [Cynocephalus volans]|uniref:gamma-interferon-inducible protein 16-like n=1 Tax=Cynocephalus volans TaxID=110931 RepID=UPI002FCC4421